jgi:hypothetical protein
MVKCVVGNGGLAGVHVSRLGLSCKISPIFFSFFFFDRDVTSVPP